nr:fimbrial-like protein [uncultured Enterobacter sp.]
MMKKTYFIKKNLLCALLGLSCLLPCFAAPELKSGAIETTLFNFKAKIVEDTCQMTLSDNGVVELGTVDLRYFGNHYSTGPAANAPSHMDQTFTPEQFQAGGKTFTLTLANCQASYRPDASQVHIRFQPRTGMLMGQSKQIFPNMISEGGGGATGAGVIISYVDNGGNSTNVLSPGGIPRDLYPMTPQDMENKTLTFYTRFQQIDNRIVTPGMVKSFVSVETYYD